MYSRRIAEADINRTIEILKAITDEQVASMQEGISKVWHRCEGEGGCRRERERRG